MWPMKWQGSRDSEETLGRIEDQSITDDRDTCIALYEGHVQDETGKRVG